MTTSCQDLTLDSPGCMAIARLMLEILDNIDRPADKRLFEAGKCEICRRKLEFAWGVIERGYAKEWDVLTGSGEAKKLLEGEYDDIRFQVTPYYYCSHVLDRWALLIDDEADQTTTTYANKAGVRLIKRFLDVRFEVSPLDVAYALQAKRKFDAAQAFAPVKGKRTAPMDNL